MIGRKAIEINLPLLKEMSLIDYYNFWTQPKNKKSRKRFYRINVPMLETLLTKAKNIKSHERIDKEEAKPKEIKKPSDDWDEFDWDAYEYGLKDLDDE